MFMIGVGRYSELAWRDALEPEVAHESSDAPSSNLKTLLDEFDQDTRTSICSTTCFESLDHLRPKPFILEVAT